MFSRSEKENRILNRVTIETTHIKLRQYISLIKLSNFDVANIKCFTICNKISNAAQLIFLEDVSYIFSYLLMRQPRVTVM